MDIEKIMAEERKRAEKDQAEAAKKRALQEAATKRNARVLDVAWEEIQAAVSGLPGIKIHDDMRQARVGNALIIVGDAEIGVVCADGASQDFAAKEWRKALETFVRAVARDGVRAGQG